MTAARLEESFLAIRSVTLLDFVFTAERLWMVQVSREQLRIGTPVCKRDEELRDAGTSGTVVVPRSPRPRAALGRANWSQRQPYNRHTAGGVNHKIKFFSQQLPYQFYLRKSRLLRRRSAQTSGRAAAARSSHRATPGERTTQHL